MIDEASPADAHDAARPADRRRALGIVYTPASVARPMVTRALAPLCAGATAEAILALRVCDPAMGDGAFVRAVIDALADFVIAAWGTDDRARARRLVAEHCVIGVDVDAAAVHAARATIAAATGADPARVARALRIGDAIAGFAWRDELPEIFVARGGFDAIVGNPPYVRQERLADKRALHAYATYDGVADLYVYFVELAHRLARPGGRYCLILPDKWMTADYGRPLRQFLAAQGSVDGVVDFGRALRLFAGADAFPCVVWGTVGGARAQSEIAALAVDESGGADGLAAVGDLERATLGISRARWTAEPWHIDAPADAALIAELERRWPSLADVLGDDRPARGVVTGCNAAFVIDRATHDALVAREPAAAAVLRRFVKGRDLRAWTTPLPERWIVLVDRGTSLAELPHVTAHLAQFRAALEPRPASWRDDAWPGRKPGAYAWCELQDPVGALAVSRAPRLMIQDIQSAAICSLDRGELVPDTTVWTLPTADPVVLAVMCSPLYWWYARRRFPPALGGAVRPKLAYLRRLPIATPPPMLRARIGRLVDACVAAPIADRGAITAAIDDAIFDAYELSAADRDLVAGAPRR